MRPYVYFGPLTRRWWVNAGGHTHFRLRGTSRAGYPSLAEAMDAAVRALTTGPS